MKHFVRFLAICGILLAVVVLADAVNLNLNGSTSSLEGFLDGNVLFVSPKGFLSALGASVVSIEPNLATVRSCEKIFKLPFVIRNRAPFLDGVLTATTLGFQASQNGLTLNVTGVVPDCKPAATTTKPNTGYDVIFSSTLELKGDGGMITSVIDGHGTLDSARVGETFLMKGEPGVPHDSTLTILAEGLIPLKYSSLTMPHDNKCSISTLDGSAYVMLLLGKSTSGKPIKVLGIDTGNGGGRGIAPQEFVNCPGKSVGLKAWHSAFNYAAKEYLGAVLAPGDQPRPMLLTLALTLFDESIYQAYPNSDAGSGVIRGLTTLQLVVHK